MSDETEDYISSMCDDSVVDILSRKHPITDDDYFEDCYPPIEKQTAPKGGRGKSKKLKNAIIAGSIAFLMCSGIAFWIINLINFLKQ